MNMVSTIKMLGIFFKYSPKCQQKLKQSITEIATESFKKKIKPLCETHWVERHTAFVHCLESIVHCLESISLSNDLNNIADAHSVTEASYLRKQLRGSSFIVFKRANTWLYKRPVTTVTRVSS